MRQSRSPDEITNQEELMATITDVREHMEIIGADGVHVGTVDKIEGDRIKMTKKDSGSHSDHHHYIPAGLIAGIEGNQVRLSATGANATLFEEEEGGEPLGEQSAFNWKTVGLGIAAVAGVAAAAGAYVIQGRRAENESRSNGNGNRSGTRTRRNNGTTTTGKKTGGSKSGGSRGKKS
jgi:hypothetical protein